MFEPDVVFNFPELADFLSPLESNDADFLAPLLGARDRSWGHFHAAKGFFPKFGGAFIL